MKINVLECGPRDGWQNLKSLLPIEEKKHIIDGLVEAGVSMLEVTSFVSPKAIPQMADASELAGYVLTSHPDITTYALVPNYRGVQNAWLAGVRHLTYVISVSESHNKANINRTHEESLNAYREMVEAYPDMECVLDLATTFGCPFEGKGGKYQDPDAIMEFLRPYKEAGMKTVNYCDTIGVADPEQVKKVIRASQEAYPDVHIQVHLHDTRGLGMVNAMAAIECGVTDVQTALAGLGGCPFAPGASGNLSTEDTVWMLNESGYETGINFSKVLAAAKYQVSKIPGNYSGHHITIDKETPCCF